MIRFGSVTGCGPGRGLGLRLVLGIGISLSACSESVEPETTPIRLSATMKLAADSLTVTLRVLNVSDTTQVISWYPQCVDGHPADFALYRDAALTQVAWKPANPASCSVASSQLDILPDQSATIRGIPVSVQRMLGDSINPGRFYVAAHPHGLLVRPKAGSFDMPVEAKVPVGPVDLIR